MPKKKVTCNICKADVTGLSSEEIATHLKTHTDPVAPSSIFGVH